MKKLMIVLSAVLLFTLGGYSQQHDVEEEEVQITQEITEEEPQLSHEEHEIVNKDMIDEDADEVKPEVDMEEEEEFEMNKEMPAAKEEKKELKKEVKKEVVEIINGEVINISTSTKKNEITLKIEKEVKGKKETEKRVIPVESKFLKDIKVGNKVEIKLVNGVLKDIKHVKKEVKKDEKLKKQENKKEVKPAEPEIEVPETEVPENN